MFNHEPFCNVILAIWIMHMLMEVMGIKVVFDTYQSLSMFKHVNLLVHSCFCQIYLKLTAAAIHLVNTFIIARVDYCNSILVWLPKYQLNRMQSVLNVAARIIYGRSRFDYITSILSDRLHWLWLPQRMVLKQCLLAYMALHGLAPVYVTDFCVEVLSRWNLRSSSSHHFTSPTPAKTFYAGFLCFEWPKLTEQSAWHCQEGYLYSWGRKHRLKTHLFWFSNL